MTTALSPIIGSRVEKADTDNGFDAVEAGPVWLLPPGAPATWSPRAVAIASPGAAAEARRRYTVGPLSLELERTDRVF